MKICQIVPSLDARHGGPSRSVLELSRALTNAGVSVDLLTTAMRHDRPPGQHGVNVQCFERKSPSAICRAPDLARHLATERYDIIHHHGLWLRTLHYAAEATRRQKQSRLVISPRGMMSPWAWQHHRRRKHWANRWVHPRAFDQAAGWHATSSAEADDIRRLGFTLPICVSPNGVSIPASTELETARDRWLQRCPEAIGQRVALFYSRFHRKKRVLELIELWAQQAPKNWLLLIVGIPEEYSVTALEDHIKRHAGPGKIRVYDGEREPPPYAVAELFLLPSHSENFGLVMAEAMAAGIPIVVTDSTPWTEVDAHDCGWCVPWGDFPGALRSALAETPTALQSRGQRAQAWMADDFSWQKTAQTLMDFYVQLQE